MVLDVFDIKLGPDAKMPSLDADNTGVVAVQVLDAIQTVVDVLTDNDGKGGWKVGFDPTVNAYTDRSANRRIVVSVKPLIDAKPGDPLAKVAAIMTGFAVHEVGHTKLNFYEAIVARWPGKQLPVVLGNVIEDVVLELRTVERYNGFADHGEGDIFRPTLEWVAEQTCPKTPLKWGGSTGHKVNMVGQMVRYRDFVTFDQSDAATRDALDFVEKWMVGLTSDLTPSGCVTLIEQLLDFIHSNEPDEPDAPEPPPVEPPDQPGGSGGQSIPNEDDDETEPTEPTEGGDQPGEGGDEPGEPGEGNPEGGDGDADDDDQPGGTEGGGDSDPDGEGKGGKSDDDDDDTEGGDDTGGESDESGPGRDGDGNDADTLNRTTAAKGTNDGLGAGGSGQAVADAGSEDPDADFDPADLDRTFDDVAKDGQDTYSQANVARAESDERVTTRLDAGAFGKMRVIFR